MKSEQMAVAGVQGLTPYQPGKPISELERELGISNIVKLASNENPLGPSPKALAATSGLLGELHLYPDGGGFELKAALADYLKVGADQITLGNGSNDVLDLVGRAFLGPGAAAVFSQHAFAVYPIVTQACGAESRVAKAHDGGEGPAYGHDLQAMAGLIDERVRVVFIANPNNPTGTYLQRDELRGFLESVPPQVVVVVDEAYFEYVDFPDYPDCLQWLESFPNLIVTRTFSKAYGLAGLRVGYAVSSPVLADLLNRVRQPFNVNTLALAAATAALGDGEHLARTKALNDAGVRQLGEAFAARSLAFIPTAGNFITVDLGRPAADVYQALLRQGVIVRPVANYGMPHHLRVSIGTEAENQTFIAALDRVLALMIERLCVVGVGLIGGSIARSARVAGLCRAVVGVDACAANLAEAKALGVIDEGYANVAAGVPGADWVVIATPVGALPEVFAQLRPHWSDSAIYTDAGSTKQNVVAAAAAAFGKMPPNFVPGHPIAGAERSGVGAANAELYRGKRVILTPLERVTDSAAVEQVAQFWEALGARVSCMDPAHHDEVLAATSHLPHVLAYALTHMLGRQDEQQEIFRYAAGGFRDFTRIASSDPRMWRDICVANRAQIVPLLERYRDELDRLAQLMAQGEAADLFDYFTEARGARQRFLDQLETPP